MAIFEIQGPDGAVYEVDAPDERAAVAGFQQFSGAQQSDFNDRFTGDGAAQWTPEGFNPQAEANAIEAARGTSGFADASGSIIKGIPFGDEIMSAAGAPIRAARDLVRGEGFDIGRAYNEGQALEAELQRRRDDRSPIASTVGAVAGGMPVAGQAAKAGMSLLQGAKPTLASMVGRGAAEGAAYGGLYGAGEGSGLEDRAKNAAFGGAVGAGTGGALGAVGRIGASKQAPLPALTELQAAKNAAYDATDALGVSYKPESYQKLVLDILKDVQAKKINPARHPKASSIIMEMVDDAQKGVTPTLRQLDEQRQVIYRDIGRDEAEKFFGNRIVGKIDDFIDGAKIGDALTGDPTAASAAVKNARELNRRYRNAQTIEEALIKAERRAASSNSGGNLENTTRQNLRRILDNKTTSRFLNETEKSGLETVIRGTKGQNVARSLGNWAKGFGGHSFAGGSVAASLMTGNPLPLAGVAVPYAMGSALKAVSRGIGNTNERIAEALVRTGSLPVGQIGPARKAIIDALTRGSAQQLPGYIGQ